jgi:flagellar motor switch protein FliN
MENAKTNAPNQGNETEETTGEGENTPGAGTKETKGNPPLKLHVNSAEDELDFVLDIPLRISVELGRAKILVQDLLKLHKGSVLELNKLAGEPLEVLVNDRILAKGEVIVVNEKFGVRLTDIVSHAQRIRQLGE